MTELLTGTRRAVEAATLAPSSHNTQPWRFRVRGGTVDLLADRTRALPVNDPVDRELTISCGAALANLVVAARAGGLEPAVEVVPDPDDTDLLARVVLRAAGDRAELELAAAIPARHTCREQFAGGPADGTLARMARGCADLGVAFQVVTGDVDRAALADLVAAGDRAQFDDPSWRRELAAWMHPRRRGDGLTVPPVTGALTRFVVSHVDVGAGTAGKDAELTRRSPVVVVLATEHDDVRSWLATGQAVERALLEAARDGVLAGYANQPCQVAALRPRLREALRLTGHPQLVLRLGVPVRPPHPAPRRPLEEVCDGV
ncbi:Acg family FMN-binding oxidoreductase [Geodermatophilus sp. SYSU D00691]